MERENCIYAPGVKKTPKQTKSKHQIKHLTEVHSFSVKCFSSSPLEYFLFLQKEIGNNYLNIIYGT